MKITFTKTFEKSILKLDKGIQIRILEKLDFILLDNNQNLDIKKLQPKDKGLYRLRVGKYRIIFDYEGEKIRLLNVDNRDSIYFN